MKMASKNRVNAIEISQLDAATFVGTYLPLTESLAKACFATRIINASNVDVGISYDGVTTHDYLQSGDILTLPVQDCAQPPSYVALFPKGFKVYINGLPGAGYVMLAGYYQD